MGQELTVKQKEITQQALQKISQGATATAILKGRFAELPVCRSVKEAIENGVPIVTLQHVTGESGILQAIEFKLIELAAQINVDQRLNIQAYQVPIIASTLYNAFKCESLEDFTLCFQRGAAGFYDDKLLRLDGAIIVKWMQKYLEEKYTLVEAGVQEERQVDKDSQVDYKAYIDRLAKSRAIEAEAEHERLKAERARQMKEMGMDEARSEYKPKGKEYLSQWADKIRAAQERTIRERNPSWTDEQVEQRLKELEKSF